MLREAVKEEFDLLVHCGDYGGTFEGGKCVLRTLKLIRKYFPDKPFISTIGNHDYWCSGKKRRVGKFGQAYKYVPTPPRLEDYVLNLQILEGAFRDHGVHYLDVDGIYIHRDHPDVVFIGTSGWYSNPNPRTNDRHWLPIGIQGDTNAHILNLAERRLWAQEYALTNHYDKNTQTLVFVSHFPVVNVGDDWKGSFADFSWSESIQKHLTETHGCQHFLNGHAHQLHMGPLRWECGPDYHNPKYQIIEV
jgi:hypothetical protein